MEMETSGNLPIGNTKIGSRAKDRIIPSKYWCFTLNNYTLEDIGNLETVFKKECSLYIFEEEVGEKGTPHLQGYIECDSKIRPIEKLKLTDRISWRKRAKKATTMDNIIYCSKDNHNIRKSDNVRIPKKLKLISELRPWQLAIEKLIKEEPNDRSIYWIYDNKGGSGKTVFTKYLCSKYNACLIDGKKNDILYACAECETDIYIFNFSRSIENFVSYDSIEKIKDGLYFAGKYESKMVIRNSPHVLIFANFEPNIDKLSIDRWEVYEIGINGEIKQSTLNFM